mmetsp:Transcript_23729/g.38037  ORF Transcript_23729/g.38037 Transcript_23729/m.38037 type:complete len:318 (-) Transcript_23729:730-1683(-)
MLQEQVLGTFGAESSAKRFILFVLLVGLNLVRQVGRASMMHLLKTEVVVRIVHAFALLGRNVNGLVVFAVLARSGRRHFALRQLTLVETRRLGALHTEHGLLEFVVRFAEASLRHLHFPHILDDVVAIGAHPWVLEQQHLHQTLRRRTHVIPVLGLKVDRVRRDRVRHFILSVAIKRRIPAQQNVHDHAQRPIVDAMVVWLVRQDLGRSIAQCAHACLHHLAAARVFVVLVLVHHVRADNGTDTKVGNLHLLDRVLDAQNVFRFEVAMHNAHVVHVLHARCQLMHNLATVHLRVVVAIQLGNLVKQFSAAAKFHDDV